MLNIYGNNIHKWDTGFSDGFSTIWQMRHMPRAALTLFEYFATISVQGKHNAMNSRFLGYNLYCNILYCTYNAICSCQPEIIARAVAS
jgi:hypothetical protein